VTFELPTEEIKPECRSCGAVRPLSDFRFFRLKPEALYMDFCTYCEQREGTLTLYRRYNAYGTKEIIEAVFAASRVPEEKRNDDQVRLLVPPKAVRAPETNEEVIQRELARRELARRRLIYFVTSFDDKYTPGWLHQDIGRRLEKFLKQVELRESPRLILSVPPRHGKSRLASDMFPSWILGQHPEWEVIQAGHSLDLPVQFSRNIRDRLKDPEYQAIFPKARLRTDSQGVESWKTTSGGSYTAAGVGVGILGKGFHVGIVDDPIKDAEAASSEVIRENTWAWYQSVFRTRAAPGAGIVVIQQRWHDADLVGKLLSTQEAMLKAGVPEHEIERWEVVEYPAIANDDEHLLSTGEIWRGELLEGEENARLLRAKGEALHPERYPLSELLKIKHTQTTQMWSAMFQQNPTPDDGDFFKRGDIQHRHLPPDRRVMCRTFMTADYAIRKKQKNDFTVLGVFALDADDNLYLVDMRRGRWGTFEIAQQVVSLVKKYSPEVYAGEQGQIHYAVWPVVKKMLDKERLTVSVDETLVPTVDKEVRARPLQARTQHKRFFMSYDGLSPPHEYIETEKELLRFPNGTFDDTVDCLAWAARLALNTSLPTKRQAKPIKSWRDDLQHTVAAGGESHMAS
jgi:hypothetical protein